MELPPLRVVLAASLALRLGIIALVDWLEIPGSHAAPTYTDIDYNVFTDAGALFLNGASPYERATFRYPPLLAWVGSLNHLVHRSAAKILFSIVDVAAGWIMHRILFLLASNKFEDGNHFKSGRSTTFSSYEASSMVSGRSKQSALLAVGCGWLFNPMVINISTRGSADTLPGALTVATIFGVLTAVRNLQQQRGLEANKLTQSQRNRTPRVEGQKETFVEGRCGRQLDACWCWGCGLPLVLSGIAQGVAVHVKLYPVVHLPGLLYFLGPCLANARMAHPPLRRWLPSILTTEVLVWLVGFVVSLALATTLSYVIYGDSFLDAALLYHLQRADHRHNYAVWWYPLYLTFGRELEEPSHTGGSLAGWRRALGLAAMVPPLLCVLLAPFGLFRVRSSSRTASPETRNSDAKAKPYADEAVIAQRLSAVLNAQARRLPLCLFVTTAVFVHANKVLTAQYFIWYLALLPLIAGRLRPGLYSSGRNSNSAGSRPGLYSSTTSDIGRGGRISTQVVALVLGAWLLCMLFWLLTAYRLEFLGHNAWTTLWLASLAFYGSSMACIGVVIRTFDDEYAVDDSTARIASGGQSKKLFKAQDLLHTKKGN